MKKWIYPLSLIFLFFILITVTVPEGAVFGSHTDWLSQHAALAETIRHPLLLDRALRDRRDSRRAPSLCRTGCRHIFPVLRARAERDPSGHLPDSCTQRSTDALSVHPGAVYVKGIYGEQKTPHIYCKEKRRILKNRL